MQGIKGIVFDMDGVLLDTETISFYTWKVIGKDYGIKDTDEAQKVCMGANRKDTITLLKRIYGEGFNSEEFLERCHDLFYKIEEKEGIPLMPGACDALATLKDKYILALATSTRRIIASRQLKNARLYDYFTYYIYGDEIEHSKPDPQIYSLISRRMGIEPTALIAIEDSPNGVKSANAAGLKVVMVPDKVFPNKEIESLCTCVKKSLFEVTSLLIG